MSGAVPESKKEQVNMWKSTAATLISALWLGLAVPATAEQAPDEVIRGVTTEVVALIESARGYVDRDPQRFYDGVEDIMEDVIDFSGFARGVMGRYGSRAHYRSLDAAGQKQLRAQAARFSEVFKDRLIQTYAKGLLAFNGNRIDVLPLSAEERGQRSVNVRQHIYADSPKPFVLIYKMSKDREGTWKVRNVSIEGINLGSTYRTQFAAAAAANGGDLDRVIDGWSVSTASLEDGVSEADEGEDDYDES